MQDPSRQRKKLTKGALLLARPAGPLSRCIHSTQYACKFLSVLVSEHAVALLFPAGWACLLVDTVGHVLGVYKCPAVSYAHAARWAASHVPVEHYAGRLAGGTRGRLVYLCLGRVLLDWRLLGSFIRVHTATCTLFLPQRGWPAAATLESR